MPSPISQFHLPMSDSARLETKMPKMSEYDSFSAPGSA